MTRAILRGVGVQFCGGTRAILPALSNSLLWYLS
jgi:hypothetical protein